MPKLFPYQVTGAKFLSEHRQAILGDEMGIGKSAQAITAAVAVGATRILVICRAVARSNWANEFEKWARGKYKPTVLYTKDCPFPGDNTVTICSYETLPAVTNAIKDAKDFKFDVVIVDEAHYLKNPLAKRTKDILGKKGIVKRTKYFWELTGTLSPNHAGELWTHLYTLGATKDPYTDFVKKFCIVQNNGFDRAHIVGTNKAAIPELRKLMEPIFLRRTGEQVGLDIPNIFYQDVVVKPGKVELDMSKTFIKYVFPSDQTQTLLKEIEAELGIMAGIVNKAFTFETFEAMKMAAKSISTLARYNGLQKCFPVLEMIYEELEAKAYDKIVVFATYRDTIETIEREVLYKLGKNSCVKVYGGTAPTKIESRVRQFQKNKDCKVFVGNINCAGTSINLTAANHVLVVEPDWVPGNNAQAVKRCHRIGQTKPVFVRFVSIADSIDQHVSNILRRKTEEINLMMDGDKAQDTSLQNKQSEATISDLI